MDSVASDLLSNGWREFGKGLFMKDDPTEIIMVSAKQSDNGVTRGIVVKRPLKKKH